MECKDKNDTHNQFYKNPNGAMESVEREDATKWREEGGGAKAKRMSVHSLSSTRPRRTTDLLLRHRRISRRLMKMRLFHHILRSRMSTSPLHGLMPIQLIRNLMRSMRMLIQSQFRIQRHIIIRILSHLSIINAHNLRFLRRTKS